MDKKEKTTDFDLSLLSYEELIELHSKIDGFIKFVGDQKNKYSVRGEDNE